VSYLYTENKENFLENKKFKRYAFFGGKVDFDKY